MYVNGPKPPTPEEQELKIDRLTEAFLQQEEFPIQTSEKLDALSRDCGQKVLYRSLVRAFGRDATIQSLGSIISEETARIQVIGLCQKEE